MQWKPLQYKDGPRGLERDKECKHTLQSTCGKYRISRDKLDSTGNYTLWAINAEPCLFRSGSSTWCCLAIYPGAGPAKQHAIHHAAGANPAAGNFARLPPANHPGTTAQPDHPPHLPPGD